VLARATTPVTYPAAWDKARIMTDGYG
jgi:hypothetical protein